MASGIGLLARDIPPARGPIVLLVAAHNRSDQRTARVA
jgi:hypothetical protein